MDDREKLRFLLSHWIHHNGEHADEYEKWIKISKEFGSENASEKLKDAIKQMDKVNDHLEAAQEILGGPLESHSDEHKHSHPH